MEKAINKGETMTDREVAGGMFIVALVYGALATVAGVAAVQWVEGLTVIPAALTSLLFLIGGVALAWAATVSLLDR